MAADVVMRHDRLTIPDGCFTAGENVAGQRPVEQVFGAWMNSSGHMRASWASSHRHRRRARQGGDGPI